MQNQGGRQVGSNQLMQHFLLCLLNHEAMRGFCTWKSFSGDTSCRNVSRLPPFVTERCLESHREPPPSTPPPLFCPYVFSRAILSNVKLTLISGLSTSPSLTGARPLAAPPSATTGSLFYILKYFQSSSTPPLNWLPRRHRWKVAVLLPSTHCRVLDEALDNVHRLLGGGRRVTAPTGSRTHLDGEMRGRTRVV